MSFENFWSNEFLPNTESSVDDTTKNDLSELASDLDQWNNLNVLNDPKIKEMHVYFKDNKEELNPILEILQPNFSIEYLKNNLKDAIRQLGRKIKSDNNKSFKYRFNTYLVALRTYPAIQEAFKKYIFHSITNYFTWYRQEREDLFNKKELDYNQYESFMNATEIETFLDDLKELADIFTFSLIDLDTDKSKIKKQSSLAELLSLKSTNTWDTTLRQIKTLLIYYLSDTKLFWSEEKSLYSSRQRIINTSILWGLMKGIWDSEVGEPLEPWKLPTSKTVDEFLNNL